MRDKTPLVLTELVIMLLVFALSAALCLKAFVWADRQSASAGAREQALRAAECAAETLKACRGDYAAAAADLGGSWDGEIWRVSYDEQWMPDSAEAVHCLQARPLEDTQDYLGMAELTVTAADGAQLSRLKVAWQEVGNDG